MIQFYSVLITFISLVTQYLISFGGDYIGLKYLGISRLINSHGIVI